MACGCSDDITHDICIDSGDDSLLEFIWEAQGEGVAETAPVNLTGATSYLSIGSRLETVLVVESTTADETGYLTFPISCEEATTLLGGASNIKKMQYDVEVVGSSGDKTHIISGDFRIKADKVVRV